MESRQIIQLLLSLVILPGCASTLQTPVLLESSAGQLPGSAINAELPFYPQSRYQCGPAALATVLVASGVETTPQILASRVYVPGKTGSYQLELVTAARDAGRLVYPLGKSNNNMEVLLEELARGHPVLVMQNLGLKVLPQWHFAIAKGYDLSNQVMILNSGQRENYELKLKTFERTWARSDYWGMVILAPGNMPATAEPEIYLKALVDLEHNSQENEALRRYYAQALLNWPEYPDLRMAYGNLMYTLGYKDIALEQYKIITIQKNDYAPAYNNLAWIEYELGRLKTALQYAEQAVSLGGDHATAYNDTFDTILAAQQATQE